MPVRSSGADAYPLFSVPDALALALSHARPLAADTLPLDRAQGHIAAADLRASLPLPPFPASVKDGYAVIAADATGIRTVVATVTAGDGAAVLLQPGQAAYITTGAPLPAGADAVVQVEDTEPVASAVGIEEINILVAVTAGMDVRAVASDIAVGDLLIPAGSPIGPADIGLAAAVGVSQLTVHAQPRVGILSTGNELLAPRDAPRPGAVYESNAPMLAAAVRAAGGIPVNYGIARDDDSALRAIFADAQRDCDLLITTGGVSMGELDLMKRLAADLGTIHFGRLLLKPGKPCTFATLPTRRTTAAGEPVDLLYFGLPGNPVSALVTFYLLVLPVIRGLAGWQSTNLPTVQAYLAEPLRLDPVRPEYHRATIRWDASLNQGAGGYRAHSTGAQPSSRLASFQAANALLALPIGTGMQPIDQPVPALLLPK